MYVGAITALVIFIVARPAFRLSRLDRLEGDAPINPYFISFLAIISGMMVGAGYRQRARASVASSRASRRGTPALGTHDFDDDFEACPIAFDGELAEIQVARWRARSRRMRGSRRAAPCVTGALLNVKSGVGTAMLPSHIGDTDSDLVRLLGPLPEPLAACYLLAHPDLRRTPRVRAFFDFMNEADRASSGRC